eukprot:scaffold266006_cov30-Tisochrysis_lutea.AAC.2
MAASRSRPPGAQMEMAEGTQTKDGEQQAIEQFRIVRNVRLAERDSSILPPQVLRRPARHVPPPARGAVVAHHRRHKLTPPSVARAQPTLSATSTTIHTANADEWRSGIAGWFPCSTKVQLAPTTAAQCAADV